MHLPTDLFNLVMSFHDVFGIVKKKERINLIIKCGFANWVTSKGCYNTLNSITDMTSLYQYSPHYFLQEYSMDIFPTRSEWLWFIQCFLQAERDLNLYPFSMTRVDVFR